MRLEHYPIEKLKRKVAEILGRHLDIHAYKVFLFGSRVSGKGDEYSDIDIGVEGPQEIPFETMARIKEDLDNIGLLYKIDVVDFKKVSSDFRKAATQHIETIS